MEDEPKRVLTDENLGGLTATSVLEAIGRGAHRPSEIAGRLGTPQTSLSKVFQALLDASLVVRDVPFGTSERDAKRSLYRIADPALRFWFSAFSPHRSRWAAYDRATRERLISGHCGAVFEEWVRGIHPGARRYWDASVEIDMVREDADGSEARRLIVSEVKWKISKRDRARLLERLEARFARSALAARYEDIRFEIVDSGALGRLARLER
jgi:AAA+ ATPase superfamily predicted ATPase